MSEECIICCVDYNDPAFVKCLGCKDKICRPCHQRYILDSIQLAHCMSCKSKWTNKFLYEQFTKTWVNKQYRDHVKKISLDREKAKIPNTLGILPRERAKVEKADKLKKLKETKSTLMTQLRDLKDQIYRLERGYDENYNRIDDGEAEAEVEEKKLNFICPCPDEECRGMIESRSFKCGVCDQRVCKRCRVARTEDDQHECDENDLETMKLIRKDTKPCPRCAVPIFKVSGCDQMFCTQCQIVFSWKTGKEETGWVHNPHALQWQRDHGGLMRDINDIPCGGLININDLVGYLTSEQNVVIRQMHRLAGEIDYTLRGCETAEFEDMRLEYVLNKITEKQWQQKIFNTERSNARKQAVREILTTLRTLIVERFRNLLETCEAAFVEERPDVALRQVDRYGWQQYPKEGSRATPKSEAAYEQFIKDTEIIRNFTNEALMTELPALGTTRPNQITKEWKWKTRYWTVV